MLRRLLFIALIAIAIASCKKDDRCRAAFDREDWAAAAEGCAARYRETRSIEHGVLAARAERKLDHPDAVISWAQELGDDPAAAVAWRGAAAAFQRRGETENARAAHLRASLLYERAKEPGEAAYHEHEALLADRFASRLQHALEEAERAYALAYQSSDAEMKRVTFTSLFTMLHDVGDFGSARALLRKTQAEVKDPEPALELYFRFYEALLHQSEKRFELAAAAYRSALLAYERLDKPRPDTRRAIRLNLVECLLEVGDVAAARTELELAEKEAPAEKPSHMVSSQAYYGALVALAEHRAQDAELVVESALSADPIPDWRWRLEQLLGRAHREQRRLEDADRAFERSIAGIEELRASIKLDDLKSTLLADKRAPYEALFLARANEGKVRAALAVSERARARAFLDALLATATSTIGGDHRYTRARFAVLDALAPKFDTSPLPAIEAVLTTLAGRDLLVFFTAEKQLFRFSSIDGREHLERVKVSEEELIRAGDRQLGRLLLDPDLSEGTRPLYVVVDDQLRRVSFAALSHRGRFLAEARALAYVPSLTALAASIELSSTSTGTPVVLGVSRSIEPSRSELRNAKREAESVATLLGVNAHVDEAATRAVLREAAHASLLHVAAHASLSPSGSRLELADGAVESLEILHFALRPRLAFIATCSSASPHAREVSGTLANAFLAAGTKTVVATSGSVADDTAHQFVEAFYAAGGARTPAAAVSAVQRAWVKAGRPIEEWSKFVVLGLAE